MIKPLGDWVVVKPDALSTDVGGFYLPAPLNADRGVVVAVPTLFTVTGELHVGDRVLYSSDAVKPAGDGKHVMLRFDDLRGVLPAAKEVVSGN